MDFFKITLVDMQTFVETFQQKSFSKAAEKLYISRQSVARSIDNLENALAHKLFVRNASGIVFNNVILKGVKGTIYDLDSSADVTIR